MSRARQKMKQLRYGEDEVDYLRNKEEQCRFAEMPQNGYNGDRHSGKVAKCVSNKHFGRISVEKTEFLMSKQIHNKLQEKY